MRQKMMACILAVTLGGGEQEFFFRRQLNLRMPEKMQKAQR